jgi:hypothetical protein
MQMTEQQTQAHNQKVHTQSLSMTRFGDGLVDPKLVLSWVLTSVGAGPLFVGLLVPVREAGSLLPQLFTAAKLRQFAVRKWWWVIGSVVQGVMVFSMALSALFLSGNSAGAAIVGCLTVFAVARSACSISYKDVLGKTVDKSRRGAVSGAASSISAIGVLVFGLLLLFQVFDQQLIVFGALFLATVLWMLAAVRFAALAETPSEIAVTARDPVARAYLGYLLKDSELQKFILVRALLTATAVAPPFLLLLAQVGDTDLLAQLGGLVVASSFASFVSGRIWGGLCDRSTPLVLAGTGLMSVLFLVVALWGVGTGLYGTLWFLPAVLFGLMVSYQGVRLARNVHLVNLANEETRAAYAAISNTIIGVVLLSTGLLGVLAEVYTVQLVIWVLVGMSLLGGLLGFSLQKP